MKSQVIINFNEENPTPVPETIPVLNGTWITFRIILPLGLKLTPTIHFLDTDPDAGALPINHPTHVLVFTEETNTYEHIIAPQIDKSKAPISQKTFIRSYLVKLIETVPSESPPRDKEKNSSSIGEPPTSSGKIEVSGGPGTELPSLV
ncbi:hypothetical protein [Myxococcus xanthus]|uniref:hypothetical protein n=1 Tax=Myxococcus xanthus TaxID=34 RepID=UPI001375D78F|nr:hypothetical protein [Myxococcus xanthus]